MIATLNELTNALQLTVLKHRGWRHTNFTQNWTPFPSEVWLNLKQNVLWAGVLITQYQSAKTPIELLCPTNPPSKVTDDFGIAINFNIFNLFMIFDANMQL